MTIKEIYDILNANNMTLADIRFSTYIDYEDYYFTGVELLDIELIYCNNKKNIAVLVNGCKPELTSDDKIIYISDAIKQTILDTYVDTKLQTRLNISWCSADRSYYEEHFSTNLHNDIVSYVSRNLMYRYKTAIMRKIEGNNKFINEIEDKMQVLAERRKKIQAPNYQRITVETGSDGAPVIMYDSCTINDKQLSISEELTYIDKVLNCYSKQIDGIKAENATLTEELTKIKEVTEDEQTVST